MKNKNFLLGLIAFILGALFGYVVADRKKEILEKIGNLEKKIKDNDLTSEIKDKAKDVIESVKSFLDKSEKVAKEEEEDILNIVEEKIKKLEKILQS
ncbi:phosphohydrolase [Sulfurihydrogenibium sp.]|jgi:signal transduction histidine kinase|uniref:phosphohydrolase n=1 Tax=Sulfurihydrogenibium sp. TaxID=2053621 RepID=UPI00260ED60D|nr:phosphohydrolase [Sulfurihydrogenibium sp.]